MILIENTSATFSVDLMAINYFTQSYWLFKLESKVNNNYKLFYSDNLSGNFRISTFGLTISQTEDLYNSTINISNGSYKYTIYNTDSKNLYIDLTNLPNVTGILKYEYIDTTVNSVYQ